MPNTYSKIYIHLVFAVKNRQNQITEDCEEGLYKYITGLVQSKGQKMIAINGTANHIHIFLGVKPDCRISDIAKDIKVSSNKFLNEKYFKGTTFQWQEGYGAFSYSSSAVENMYNYVMNQKEHHKKFSFKDEYLKILDKFGVDYDEKYLFEWI